MEWSGVELDRIEFEEKTGRTKDKGQGRIGQGSKSQLSSQVRSGRLGWGRMAIESVGFGSVQLTC